MIPTETRERIDPFLTPRLHRRFEAVGRAAPPFDVSNTYGPYMVFITAQASASGAMPTTPGLEWLVVTSAAVDPTTLRVTVDPASVILTARWTEPADAAKKPARPEAQ